MIKDISKILKEGSIKQKLRLLIEHYANLSTGETGLLTEKEAKALVDTFRTPQELRAYNRVVEVERLFRPALYTVNQYRISYREAIANITGYSQLWQTYKENEDLLNTLLIEVEDKKLRAKLTKTITTGRGFYLWSNIEKDEEGYIRFNTGEPRKRATIKNKKFIIEEDSHSLEDMLGLWKERAELYICQTKTLIKALTEWMDENDYKPTPYVNMIKEILEDVEEDKSYLPKFSKARMRGIMHERTEEVLSKHFFYPNAEEIGIDEVLFKRYRRDYLGENE